MILISCGSTRYLGEGKRMLSKQSVIAPEPLSTEELKNLTTKKPNRKLLGFMGSHLVWMYYTGQKYYNKEKHLRKKEKIEARFDRLLQDTTRRRSEANVQFRKSRKVDQQNLRIENGNNFMRWGEPLALFDYTDMKQSAARMTDYLFSHGYFQGSVNPEVRGTDKKAEVTYRIMPGPSYQIDSIFISCPSEDALKIISHKINEDGLQRGSRFSQDRLNKTRENIEVWLRNQGYYNFSRQMVYFDADTSFRRKNKILLGIIIDAPDQALKQYRLDTIKMIPDVGMEKFYPGDRDDYYYRRVKFQYFNRKYHKKVLTQRIFMQQDSLYSRDNTFTTQRQLANLDMFKFVNINYDTSDGQFIANIFASPLERYSWSNETGVSVTQGFPGPYYSMNFKRRNLFRALDILEFNGRFGFEGVASATQQNDFYQSTEANINGTITLPQLLIPISGATALRLARFNPRTKLLAGYTYTSRPEYTRSIITASSTLNWDKPNGLQFALTGTNLNIIRSDTSALFGERLRELEAEGNRLINAFKPAFVSNMSLSVTWNPKDYGNTEASSYFLRATLESGGTSLNIISPSIISNLGLQPYQYIRLNVDARRTSVINKHTLAAFRVNSGFGYAYSENKVLPYEKNFFIGGSNSIRAWRPRRLGPGALPPSLSANPETNGLFDYRFEKPGDLLLEASAELRQKLFGFVNYAVFVDAGNVWSLQSNTDPRAKFSFNRFLSEFGVGTGVGLRFDFTFLIMRLDMGVKVFDPARPKGDRFVLDNVRVVRPFGTNREPVIFNIGIGYPF